MLRHLDLGKPEGAHHLDQDHNSGDDRRRPPRVEPRDGDALRPAYSRRAGSASVDRRQGEPRAMDGVRVVGIERLVDRGK